MASKVLHIQVNGLSAALRRLQELGERAPEAAAILLKDFADTQVVGPAKEIVPVDTGALRATIQAAEPVVSGTKVTVSVSAGGPAAPYALCIGARMKVAVNGKGMKQMSSVRIGDRVLTQAGIWKPVKNVFRYAVQDETVLLRIYSNWRKGKEHMLEVTENHEIMVSREGKNQWIRAGDLIVGDRLYQRKKHVHNTGLRSGIMGACKGCGMSYYLHPSSVTTKHRQFHSIKCYWAWRARPGNNPLAGMPRPADVVRKMSLSTTARLRREPEKHPLRVLARKGHKSSHEVQIAEFLDTLGIRYEHGATVGKYHVDFLCPDLKRIIEADGCRWHQDQTKDIQRDRDLLGILGNEWDIVHVHYFEVRWSPKDLQPNPLPNVYYVAVNPGPATYAEPSMFDLSVITKIERTIYRLDGGTRKYVYDLEVADIQSYTVSGLLVHNSVHENPRSGQTGGVSPSGKKYKEWARAGEWKFIERPALAAATSSGSWLQEHAKVLFERLRR